MEAAIDFSIWALFSRATLPVQAVIVLLIGLSIWSWTIAINKRIALNLARRRSAKFDKAFWSGEPLDGLFDKIGAAPKGGSELIFTAGMTEWRRSHRSDGVLIAGAQSRIERSMDVALAKQSNDLQSGLAILAVTFDAIQETQDLTNIRLIEVGTQVNVERSAKQNVEIGGHVLSGHIVGTAPVVDVLHTENNCRV